jgi:hypothetical protein
MREMLPFGPGVFAWGLVTGVAMIWFVRRHIARGFTMRA